MPTKKHEKTISEIQDKTIRQGMDYSDYLKVEVRKKNCDLVYKLWAGMDEIVEGT